MRKPVELAGQISFSQKSPYKEREYEILKYRDFIGEYLFFLHSGEITLELVNKKNLKEDILKVYE